MPFAGGRTAPRVRAALAGVVHDTAGHEHSRDEDNQQGDLHCDLPTTDPREPSGDRIIGGPTEPTS
jgi:hypothetical protein